MIDKSSREIAGEMLRTERRQLTRIVRCLMRDYLNGTVDPIGDPLGPGAPPEAQACSEILERFRRHVRECSARIGGSGRR